MTEEEFHEYAHSAFHELMELNRQYTEQFKIGNFERWDYRLEKGTLTFSNQGIAYVVAEIQAAGSIALKSKSWMWGWANESLPENVTQLLPAVRQFGETNDIANWRTVIGRMQPRQTAGKWLRSLIELLAEKASTAVRMNRGSSFLSSQKFKV